MPNRTESHFEPSDRPLIALPSLEDIDHRDLAFARQRITELEAVIATLGEAKRLMDSLSESVAFQDEWEASRMYRVQTFIEAAVAAQKKGGKS